MHSEFSQLVHVLPASQAACLKMTYQTQCTNYALYDFQLKYM
jgi:hypothetical protein